MLVIGRKPKQKVILFLDGQEVAEITVVKVRGNTVRLGVVALPQVKVWREEIRPGGGELAELRAARPRSRTLTFG